MKGIAACILGGVALGWLLHYTDRRAHAEGYRLRSYAS